MSSMPRCWSLLPALCLCSFAPLIAQSTANQQFVTPTQLKVNSTSTEPASAFAGILGVADFNTDGHKDILGYELGANGPKAYAVLLAEADGSYTPRLTGIPVAYDPALGTISDTVKIADMNGDGRPDLVIVTSSPSSDPSGPIYPIGNSILNVYLGNGDGTFHPVGPVIIGQGVYAHVEAVTDMNKDGKPDLILETDPGDTVGGGPNYPPTYTVWINQGGGKFNSAVAIGEGGFLAVGDLNGDGYPEVVLSPADADGPLGGIQVFLNENGASFKPGAYYPNFTPTIAALGDLNHDHKLDMVAVQVNENQFESASPVHTLLGNGDGTFRTGSSFQTTFVPSSITIADVTGDNVPDISFLMDYWFLTDGTFLQVFPGNGDGTVKNPTTFDLGAYGVGYPIVGATLVDLKNDGKLDVLMPDFPGYGISVNDGKGNFRAPRMNVAQPNRGQYWSLTSADFNKDGKADVAVLSAGSCTAPAAVVVYPGTGKGYFGPARSYNVPARSYSSGVNGALAVGDVNGDGKLDLVVAGGSTCSKQPADVSVLLGNGDGTFQPAINSQVLNNPQGPVFAALADVNGDGKLDLVGAWGVALGKGDGTFDSPIPLPSLTGNVFAMAGGDFNHDGILDLAIATDQQDNLGNLHGYVYVLLGNGKGGYAVKGQEQLANTSFAGSLAIADMNGDGKPDLIFSSAQNAGATHTITVRLGNGNGTFGPAVNYPLGTQNYLGGLVVEPILVGDLNRDGKPDLFLTQPLTQPGGADGGLVSVLYGLGGGKLSAIRHYPTAVNGPGVLMDMNGDGALDYVGDATLNGLVRMLNTGSRMLVTK